MILSSALSIAIGWWQIRQGRIVAHKRFMIMGSILAALFFIGYVTKTVVVGDTTFGGPSALKAPYQVFLQMHSILAVVAAVLGIMTLRLAYKRTFDTHRRIGRWAATVWLVAVGSGLVVFLFLYIIFPPGPTTNIFRAWIGW